MPYSKLQEERHSVLFVFKMKASSHLLHLSSSEQSSQPGRISEHLAQMKLYNPNRRSGT